MISRERTPRRARPHPPSSRRETTRRGAGQGRAQWREAGVRSERPPPWKRGKAVQPWRATPLIQQRARQAERLPPASASASIHCVARASFRWRVRPAGATALATAGARTGHTACTDYDAPPCAVRSAMHGPRHHLSSDTSATRVPSESVSSPVFVGPRKIISPASVATLTLDGHRLRSGT